MDNYLEHHGILGQKWGVRRYQNPDGTLTSAGKKRYGDDESYSSEKKRTGLSDSQKKTLAKVGAVAAGTALTVAALSNENIRNSLVNAVTNPKVKESVVNFVKDQGTKAAKSVGDSVKKAGKAMTDAALVSIGTIQINKLAKSLETNPDDSESIKNRNQILLDTATAGIRSVTNVNAGNGNNKSGGNVGKNVSNVLGEPSKKGIDKNSSDYQNLFKDSNGNQRDQNTRAIIKSLASAGYDTNQIKQYVDGIDNGTIKHGSLLIGSDYIGRSYIMRMN